VTVHVELARDESMLIALSGRRNRFDLGTADVHGTRTNADSALRTGVGAVAIRASRPGRYRSSLSNGKTVRTRVPSVPREIDLTTARWHLSAEDWRPTNPYGTTFGRAATQTTKDPVELDLRGLKPWPQIPQLADASGVGTYTTTG
jgi:hypothetical protein